MKKNTKVSLITVCYNAEKTIERTIKSVLSQSYSNIEYIIIDGKSTDSTLDLVNNYKLKISKIISEPDGGIYDAMNKGISYATGSIVGIINSDDWYEKDAVENIVRTFESTDAGIVYGKARMIYEDQSSTFTEEGILDNLWYNVVMIHPAVFIKKEVYDNYGLYDLSYKLSADYELLLRCYTNSVKYVYTDKYIVNYVLGGQSSKEFAKGVKEVKEISLKYAHKYTGEKDIYNLIENRYKNSLCNMALQGSNVIIKDIFEKFFSPLEDGIYIWGAGYYGQTFYRVLTTLNIPIKGFLDSNKEKQTNYKNIPVYNPHTLSHSKCNVFIAIKELDEEIQKQIRQFRNNNLHCLTLSELNDEIINLCIENDK